MSEPTKEQINKTADEIIDACCTDDMRDIARWHLTQLAQITGERDEAKATANAHLWASDKVGKWLSAALEDEKVCAEMKQDITEWFAAITEPVGNELVAERDRYKEALQWYADFAGTTAIEYDYGQRADKALNPTPKDAQ